MIAAIERLFPRKVLRAGGLFFSRSYHSFSSLIFSFLAGRMLTVEEHGLYGQYFARIIVFQAILEAGLQYSIIRYLAPVAAANDRQEAAEIIRASLKLKLYAWLIVCVALLYWLIEGFLPFRSGLFPDVRAPDHIVQGSYVVLSALGLSFFSYFDSLLVSFRRYRSLTFWIPTTGTLRIVLLFALYFLNDGTLRIDDVLYAFMAGAFLAWPFYFRSFDASLFFAPARKERVRAWIDRLMHFNRWIVLASFFSILSDWMEVLLLQEQTDAALYNAARMPMQGFLILLATMQSILLPKFTTFTKKDEYVSFFKKMYAFIAPALVLLLPGFWLFAWFIPVWFGDEYTGSVALFFIIYPGFMLRLLFAPLGTALFALDQPRIIGIEAGLRMLGGIVINSILIPLYGAKGAAISSVLSQFPGWIFLVYCYLHYYRRGSFPPALTGRDSA